MAKNPIIAKALKKGFKSGGMIGDISGGIPAQISVKGGGDSSSRTPAPSPVDETKKERIEAVWEAQKAERNLISTAQKAGLVVYKMGGNIIIEDRKRGTKTVVDQFQAGQRSIDEVTIRSSQLKKLPSGLRPYEEILLRQAQERIAQKGIKTDVSKVKINIPIIKEMRKERQFREAAKARGLSVPEYSMELRKESIQRGRFLSLPKSVQENILREQRQRQIENRLVQVSQKPIPYRGAEIRKFKDLSQSQRGEYLRSYLPQFPYYPAKIEPSHRILPTANRLAARVKDKINLLKNLGIFASRRTTVEQKNQALQNLSYIISKTESISNNKELIKDIVWTYANNYMALAKGTFFTRDGLYRIFRTASSPFIGAYKSIEQVGRDISLSAMVNIIENYRPSNQAQSDLKQKLQNWVYKAISSSEQNRQRYKQDILNAMVIEGIMLVVVGATMASGALTTAGYTQAATITKGAVLLPLSAYGTYAKAVTIVNPTPENVGMLLDITLINRINRAGVAISFRKYLRKISNPIQRKIVANIWKIGKVVKGTIGKTRLGEIDYRKIIKSPKVWRAFDMAVKQTRAVLYGSKLEYNAKLSYIRNVYSKLYGKRLTNQEAVNLLYRNNKNLPKWIFKRLLEPPKDLDMIIQKKYVNSFIKKMDAEYRYLPKMLQEYARSKAWTRNMELGLRLIRRNKRSVLSQLSKQQIDDILKGMTTNGETTAFKLQFLECLYRQGVPSRILKAFDLADSGLENPLLKLKLDLHSDSEVAFTKKILGFIVQKQSIPLEKGKSQNFRQAIINLQKTKDYIILQREKYLRNIADRFALDFKRYGLILNKDKFVRIFPKFLQRSEIMDVKGFDFLQTPKSGYNKKILRAYQEAIDFLVMNTPSAIARRGTVSRDVKINLLVQKLVNYARRTANKISAFESAISQLDARRMVMAYYSTGSRKLWDRVSKFGMKDFKLKKELSPIEQQKLLNLVNKFDTFMQSKFTDKIIRAEIARMKFGTKEMIKYGSTKGLLVDLGKALDRDVQNIKGFKTSKLQVTKEGRWRITLKEQVKRRVAGAISRIFEQRRAKDMKKLYDEVKLVELLQRNILSKMQSSTLPERLRLVARFRKGSIILKLKINQIKKLASQVTSDIQRIEDIYTTKGVSETIGLKEINFDNYNKMNKAVYPLMIRKPQIKQIEYLARARVKGKISRTSLIRKTDNILAKQIIKAAENRIIPSKAIRYLVSQIRMVMLPILVSRVRLSESRILYPSASLSASISPSMISSYMSQSRSLSRSVSSLSRSISLSQSLSKSQSKSASRSISISKSLSQSLSKSQSKSQSKSLSKSLSRSLSKSMSKSISRSTSRTPPPHPTIPPTVFWDSQIPRNISLLVNPIVRMRKRNIELNWRTTPNRALRRVIRLIDNTTSRSFQLKIVGITKYEDIPRVSLKKFRTRIGKDKRVLNFVEKNKYSIDTKGEKRGLRLGKILRRRR